MRKVNMPQDALNFMQKIQEYGLLGYGWILILSMWAGTAKYLSSLNGKKPTFWGWLTETTISGFVGVVTAMTCQYYQLDFTIASAITGMAAYNGAHSLNIIASIIKKNPSYNMEIDIEESTAKTRLASKKVKDNGS